MAGGKRGKQTQGAARRDRPPSTSQLREMVRLRKLDLIHKGFDIIKRLVEIGAWAIPLKVIQWIAADIAGTTTDFSFRMEVSILVSATLLLGNVEQARRARIQKKDLVALRTRIRDLESQLLDGAP